MTYPHPGEDRMRTFEFDDGKSQKFWNIELQGDQFTVNFGKLGSKGQSQTKTFADTATALKEHDKLVAEKLKKGYRETSSGGGGGAETVAGPATPSPLQSSMERALLENPEDLVSHMAYADYLHEQGDTRGDFIQVQLALENEKLPAAERKKLQAQEQALLAANQRAWLGAMAPFWLDQVLSEWQIRAGSGQSLTWRRGWIDELQIDYLSDDLAKAVLAQQHLLGLLRSLKILGRDYENPGFPTLLGGGFFAHVRHFQIGRDNDSCHQEGENTVDFVQRMPLLEELHTFAHQVDTEALFDLDLPHLRKLTVHHIHEYPLELLADNESLGNVTHLSFWPHGLEPDDAAAYISSEAAQALFTSANLTSLTHLTLRLSDTGDSGIAVLVESGLLGRLRVLDLYGGCITDEGAHLLAACPEFTNLEHLNIGSNMLTEEGVLVLRETGVEIESTQQYDADEIDEREYLWEGDPE